MLTRHIEYVRIQEFENRHPHLLVTSITNPYDQAEPALALQFLLGNSLDHIHKFLRDQKFKFTERLPVRKSS